MPLNTLNLTASEQILIWQKTLDAVNQGLILIDREGRVLLWNEWVAHHSGIPSEYALTRPLESLFLEGLTISFRTALKRALAHRLPILISNALHRAPLPLYSPPITRDEQPRIQQSITITPVLVDEETHFCLIQITDASLSLKRENLLKSQSERLNREATTDVLTGAYNRRFFNDRYRSELGRAQRQGAALSLVMIDIDFFKNYNDHYGHPAGDKILVAVVNALKAQLNRPTDMVVRYGGEEFMVLLPDVDTEGSLSIAEKLRLAVADLQIPHADSKVSDHVTISVGAASLQSKSACHSAALLEAADSALYSAKNSGRNCVRHVLI